MKSKKISILLAEDDQNLGFLLKEYLEMENFNVTLCRDGEEAEETFLRTPNFDICILDVMMPKKDGFTLAKNIKMHNTAIPILFLSAKGLKEDKIEGFGLGADDYITKPFDEEELVLRIKAILKRTSHSKEENTQTVFEIGKYIFDYERHELIFNGQVRRMTSRESDILRLLILRKDNVLKREDALIAIWGENDYFHGRSFDVFITKLRKYLKDDPTLKIENIHGVGFMLTDKP
jgi:DNA-binding response OmpR family regulator